MSLDFSTVTQWTIPEGEVLSASLNGVQVWEKQSPTPTPAITADVTFIDYDGTILYEYSAADFLNLSALPATVNHTSLGDGLGAGSWNWTLSEAKKQVQNCGKVIIGQTCDVLTTQGIKDINSSARPTFTLFFENIDNNVKLCYSPGYYINYTNYAYHDWGDGNVTTFTPSGGNAQTYSHNYTSPGSYTVTAGWYGTVSNPSAYGMFNKKSTGNAIPYEPTDNSMDNDIYYKDRVTKMYIAYKFSVMYITSWYDYLKDFTIMKNINFDSRYDDYGGGTRSIYGSFLNGATSLVAYVSKNPFKAYYASSSYYGTANYLSNTPSLKVLSLAYGTASGTDSTLATVKMCNNSGIEQIYLTYNFQKITDSFNSCSNLREAILPCGSNSNTVKIDGCFKDCSALQTLKFTSTKSSSMYNITNNSFQNLPTTCKIYVPSAKMADYKALSGMPDPTVYEYIGY